MISNPRILSVLHWELKEETAHKEQCTTHIYYSIIHNIKSAYVLVMQETLLPILKCVQMSSSLFIIAIAKAHHQQYSYKRA